MPSHVELTRVKLVRVLLLLLMVGALLTGCAGGAGRDGPKGAGTFHPATPGVLTVTTSVLHAQGFWEGPPNAPDGGFEYALADALAQRFGLHSVRVVLVPFDKLIGGDLGGADLALARMTPTPQRAQRLDFSVPYMSATTAALVRAGTAVPDVDAARRLRWAALRGTTLTDAIARQIRPEQPVRETDPGLGQPEPVRLLRQGLVDAVLIDLPYALVIADRSAGALTVAAQLPGGDDFAAALPKGSPNLEAVDAAIRAFRADGTLERLSHRWLGADVQKGAAQIPVLRTGG